jgi:DNA-binding transcriptional regulator YiaG
MRYKPASIAERDAAVERLREFIRLNYVSGKETARRIGVSEESLYSWLSGNSRPAKLANVL